jgi:hypothetical protein
VSPPSRTTKRLVQLFERDLREYDASLAKTSQPKATPRVSRELEQQVAEFVAATRTSGGTPEQMLVELKSLLSRVAPDVSSSERNALVATLTGRAIDVFFGASKKREKS